MRKLRSIMAVIICAAMCACACAAPKDAGSTKKPGATAEDTGKDQADKKEKEYQKKLDLISPSAYDNVMGLKLPAGTTLSVIGKAEGAPYWDEVKKGAEQAVEDINENLGYEGRDKVKVTYSAPGEPDNVDEQVNILDEELARYPAAVAIAIADARACEVQFDLAAESDIPVVAFDSGSDYQGLMATVETDNRAAAKEAAARMAELVEDAGEIILIIHDSKSESAMSRESGFREELAANHPDITVAEVCYLDQLAEMKEKIAAEINAGTWSLNPDEGVRTASGTESGADGSRQDGAANTSGRADGRGQDGAANTSGRADGSGQDGASGMSGSEQNGQTGTSGTASDVQAGNAQTGTPASEDGQDTAAAGGVQGAEPVDGAVTADMITEEDVTDYIFGRHPEAKGIYATNGEAVRFALDAVEHGETKIPIIGYDADEDEIEALKDGRVEALIVQNPFGMGYAAVIASARAALSMGNEAVVDTGYFWLTRKNLEDDSIQKILYAESRPSGRFRWI